MLLDLEKYLICEKEKSEKVPEEHDGVLKSFLVSICVYFMP